MTMDDLIRDAQAKADTAKALVDARTATAERIQARIMAGDNTIRTADVETIATNLSAAKSELRAATDKLDEFLAHKADDDRVDALSREFHPTGVKRSSSGGTYRDGQFQADAPTAAAKGHLSFHGMSGLVREAARREGLDYSTRSLLAVGSTAIAPILLTENAVSLGKPATGILDVVPVRTVAGGTYSYLRQTVRTNNAAPVAVGALKPTSVMTMARVTGDLEVVAHLSEAIPEQWLEDAPSLNRFIEDELAAGLNSALEVQLDHGTGVSPQLDGILTTATGTQAYATSPLVTIRTGLSQLEAAGLVPSAIILAAADWLAIELALLTTDGFMLGNGTSGAPLDSVKRTLWGTPVVVSVAHVAGTALILSEESVGLVTDGNIDFMWGRIADDFAKNQVRARCEIRAGVEIFRPSGVIVADLVA